MPSLFLSILWRILVFYEILGCCHISLDMVYWPTQSIVLDYYAMRAGTLCRRREWVSDRIVVQTRWAPSRPAPPKRISLITIFTPRRMNSTQYCSCVVPSVHGAWCYSHLKKQTPKSRFLEEKTPVLIQNETSEIYVVNSVSTSSLSISTTLSW